MRLWEVFWDMPPDILAHSTIDSRVARQEASFAIEFRPLQDRPIHLLVDETAELIDMAQACNLKPSVATVPRSNSRRDMHVPARSEHRQIQAFGIVPLLPNVDPVGPEEQALRHIRIKAATTVGLCRALWTIPEILGHTTRPIVLQHTRHLIPAQRFIRPTVAVRS